MLALITLWLVLPPLASDHAPPRPTDLYVGINTEEGEIHTTAQSTLELDIRASGCRNPATVEGVLTRPAGAWRREQALLAGPAPRGPTQEEVVLAGAKLRRATGGLSGGEFANAPLVGRFAEPMILGKRRIYSEGRRITVHDSVSGLLALKPSGEGEGVAPSAGPVAGVALNTPQWPAITTSGLHFVLKADLVHPDGFQRCYVDVPELLRPGFDAVGSAFDAAQEFAESAELGQPAVLRRGRVSAGLPYSEDVARAEVSVEVSGDVVDPSTLGAGGLPVLAGAHYACHEAADSNEQSLADSCLASPVFETPGTAAQSTTRLFVGAIVGALGATLTMEALFLGETERRRSPRPRRRRASRS